MNERIWGAPVSIAISSGRARFLPDEAKRPALRPGRGRLGAMVLWLLWPVLAVAALALPPFLLLAIAFGCGFLVLATHHLSGGNPAAGLFRLPSGGAMPGLFGLLGASLLWLLALGQIFPAAAVTAGPWPVLGAAADALAGQPVPGPLGGAALGHVLALCGALCWIATADARRRWTVMQPYGPAGLYGLAMPICLLLHLCLEPRLPLDGGSVLAAAALGAGPLGLARLLWEQARAGRLSEAPRRGATGR